MSEDKANEISSDVLEHPSLDLNSIFQEFRFSGSISADNIDPIKTFLEECQKDVNTLDTKIKDLISTISQLSRELTEASTRMVQKASETRLCEFLLSSHKHLPKHLPQDVIEEIFLACMATNVHPSPKSHRPPLQLAAICHRWRTIALAMPTLWNTLYIRIPNHLELARTWLGRCYLPSLTVDVKKTDFPPSELQEILDVFQTRSLSPRTIDVRMLNGQLGDIIKEFILDRDQFSLEELVIVGRDGVLPSLPKTSTPLRRFYSQIIPQTWHHSPPPSDLTVLWLTPEVHYTVLPIFLANCPNLESLYVALSQGGARLDPESESEPEVSKDVTLSRLLYFGIWERPEGESPEEDLLQPFSFPSLRIVEYCHSKTSPPWLGFAPVLQFARRLTLQSDEGNLSSEFVIQVLQHATSLVELVISTKVQLMADVITALTSTVLPTLRTLYFDVGFNKPAEWLPFEPQLTKVGLTSKDMMPSLIRLVIQLWIKEKDKDGSEALQAEDCLKVKKMVGAACPDLQVQIVSILDTDWFWDVPVSFGMVPLPSNGVDTHELLEDNGSWTKKSGSVYHIM